MFLAIGIIGVVCMLSCIPIVIIAIMTPVSREEETAGREAEYIDAIVSRLEESFND